MRDPKIESLNVHRTSDGQMFEEHKDAVEHENQIIFTDAMERAIQASHWTGANYTYNSDWIQNLTDPTDPIVKLILEYHAKVHPVKEAPAKREPAKKRAAKPAKLK